MEALYYSETLLFSYQTTSCHKLEDHNMNVWKGYDVINFKIGKSIPLTGRRGP
jgi:hypothetical protein